MFLFVETNAKGGMVRDAAVFGSEREALDWAVERARDSGYFTPGGPTVESLLAKLRKVHAYADSGIVTTIIAVKLVERPCS